MSLYKARLESLVKQIRYHSDIYYRQDHSEISDADYDLLVQEYNQIINTYPELLTDDTDLFKNQAVALDDVSHRFEKVNHEPAMLSLDNVFSLDQYKEWKQKLPESVREDIAEEWKFDGIALRLVYDYGKLNQILTRGTGLIGEDVTEAFSYYSNIPEELTGELAEQETVMVDGEGVILIKTFDYINQLLPAPYMTPRHAASGITRNRTLGESVGGTLDFIAHTFPNSPKPNYDETLDLFSKAGFLTTGAYPTMVVRNTDRPTNFPYAVDGLVGKVKDYDVRKELGVTGHHPKWAIAYKFPTLKETTKLTDVVWETGRTGTITPVAEFTPVNIAGVSVRRATLHNFRTFQRESEGLRIGSEITVGMAGDIIPQFFSVDKVGKGRQCKPPKSCPSCNEPLHYEGADQVQVFLTCTNHSGCPAQAYGRILNFGSEHGMNIRGLGPVAISRFMEMGYLNQFSDLYSLRTMMTGQPLSKNELKLLDEIDLSKKTTLTRFITALGINGVAKGTARVLAEELNNPETLLDDLCDTKRLTEIKDIGWGIALNCAAYVQQNRAALELLMKELTFEDLPPMTNLIPVCVTGNFPFRRKALAHELLKLGVEVTDRVNSKTKLVVLGEYFTKHKEQTALDMDIPTMLVSVHPELTVSELVSTIMGRL
ncbi:DNA ligase [Vibrio phage phiKT1028]|nr:DNA ligase [Vibrio phage phiKT1028]